MNNINMTYMYYVYYAEYDVDVDIINATLKHFKERSQIS